MKDNRKEIYGFNRLYDKNGNYLYQIQCIECGKIIKASGVGIGSHRYKHLREQRKDLSNPLSKYL